MPPRARKKKGTAVAGTPNAGPSKRLLKRTEGRATDIPDDPISLFASDDETNALDGRTHLSHHSSGSKPSHVDSILDDTELRQSCRTALEQKLDEVCATLFQSQARILTREYQLQPKVDFNLKEVFNQEALDLLCVVLPSGIHHLYLPSSSALLSNYRH